MNFCTLNSLIDWRFVNGFFVNIENWYFISFRYFSIPPSGISRPKVNPTALPKYMNGCIKYRDYVLVLLCFSACYTNWQDEIHNRAIFLKCTTNRASLPGGRCIVVPLLENRGLFQRLVWMVVACRQRRVRELLRAGQPVKESIMKVQC